MYRHVKHNVNETASFTRTDISVCSWPNALRNAKEFLRQISLINHFQETRNINININIYIYI